MYFLLVFYAIKWYFNYCLFEINQFSACDREFLFISPLNYSEVIVILFIKVCKNRMNNIYFNNFPVPRMIKVSEPLWFGTIMSDWWMYHSKHYTCCLKWKVLTFWKENLQIMNTQEYWRKDGITYLTLLDLFTYVFFGVVLF